jgi:hypothetical protein
VNDRAAEFSTSDHGVEAGVHREDEVVPIGAADLFDLGALELNSLDECCVPSRVVEV